ncbi:MAG: hypothetical protein RI953_2751 [Pseudomonadota bacterium]|jgi:hypothetical protein
MRKLSFVLGIVAVGCGVTQSNNEALQVRFLANGEQSRVGMGEDTLGIAAANSKQQGSSATVVNRSNAEPLKIHQAFGSYVRFVSPTTGQQCAGVYSYEPDPTAPGKVNVYFNSAVHCFEKVNPLGIATLTLKKSGVVLGSASVLPKSFIKPYGYANSLSKSISFSRVEVLLDKSGKPTDAIRLLVDQQPLASAEKSFLPSCDKYVAVSGDKALHAMGWSDSLNSLFIAGVRASGLNGLPTSVSDMLNSVGQPVPTVFELEGVGSVAGESGGPVFQVQGRAETNRVDGYECVHGVISREVVTPEIKGVGSLSLKFSTFYTPITGTAQGFTWKDLL